MADPPPLPVTVTLGESLFAVAERHPDLFETDRMLDDSAVNIERRLKLTVAASGSRLAFPPTLYVQMSQAAGVVTGVFLSPTPRLLTLEDAHALALRLMALAAEAGWSTVAASPPDLDRFRADAAGVQGKYGASYADYRRGSATLNIATKRPASSAGKPPQDLELWLVDVDLFDRAVDDRQAALLAERREQAGAGAASLPLSAWRPR